MTTPISLIELVLVITIFHQNFVSPFSASSWLNRYNLHPYSFIVFFCVFNLFLILSGIMQEEEGWPLGLRPLNVRPRDYDFSGSISCNTLLSGSPALTSDSSDVDTQVCNFVFMFYAYFFVFFHLLNNSRSPVIKLLNTQIKSK